MKLLFFRNTNRKLTSEEESIWNSQIHAGGFVGQMLDSDQGTTFLKLMDSILAYENTFGESSSMDEILAALFELVRVGLIRYEINEN